MYILLRHMRCKSLRQCRQKQRRDERGNSWHVISADVPLFLLRDRFQVGLSGIEPGSHSKQSATMVEKKRSNTRCRACGTSSRQFRGESKTNTTSKNSCDHDCCRNFAICSCYFVPLHFSA